MLLQSLKELNIMQQYKKFINTILTQYTRRYTIGKVKNWAWDMAETYLDELITKIKDGTLTVATALAEAKTKDVALYLVGIHSESELEEVLESEVA